MGEADTINHYEMRKGTEVIPTSPLALSAAFRLKLLAEFFYCLFLDT